MRVKCVSVRQLFFVVALLLFNSLTGCTLSGEKEFKTEFDQGEYTAMWSEVLESVPAIADKTVYLEKLFGFNPVDSEGYLEGLFFEIMVPKSEQKVSIYSVALTQTTFSLSRIGTESRGLLGSEIEVSKVLATLEQLPPRNIIDLSPIKGESYAFELQFIEPLTEMEANRLVFSVPIFNVERGVLVGPIKEPFTSNTGGILMDVIPMNDGMGSELALQIFFSF